MSRAPVACRRGFATAVECERRVQRTVFGPSGRPIGCVRHKSAVSPTGRSVLPANQSASVAAGAQRDRVRYEWAHRTTQRKLRGAGAQCGPHAADRERTPRTASRGEETLVSIATRALSHRRRDAEDDEAPERLGVEEHGGYAVGTAGTVATDGGAAAAILDVRGRATSGGAGRLLGDIPNQLVAAAQGAADAGQRRRHERRHPGGAGARQRSTRQLSHLAGERRGGDVQFGGSARRTGLVRATRVRAVSAGVWHRAAGPHGGAATGAGRDRWPERTVGFVQPIGAGAHFPRVLYIGGEWVGVGRVRSVPGDGGAVCARRARDATIFHAAATPRRPAGGGRLAMGTAADAGLGCGHGRAATADRRSLHCPRAVAW
eukprot:ctg_2045.g474